MQAAARRGPLSVQQCVQLLETDQSAGTASDLLQNLRLIRISIAPHIPLPQLSSYLSDVADQIMDAKTNSASRFEMAGLAFKTIIEDFPDASKGLGMEWWMSWRDQFEERSGAQQGLKAKM